MFARKQAMSDVKQSDLEIIPAMARAVAKGSALQLAEAGIEGLRKRRQEIADEQAERIREYQKKQNSSIGRQINLTVPIIAALEKEITAEREKVSEMRRERADRVADALAPIRRDAAKRALAAINELHEASDILIAAAEEIRKSGNPDIGYLNRAPVVSLIEHANRILGKKS
jgi:hypothetical protein